MIAIHANPYEFDPFLVRLIQRANECLLTQSKQAGINVRKRLNLAVQWLGQDH